ncbi:MAG: hypothetical protein A3F11_08465 [Gammaproteobacteria bacterium RIFCSPHIGHO2_12_FULL_37_14]|nr:MAG: hypothetical protein A3F11_08465 [Gammaproteobacteria bacterium RIFCSPHIGHO2_12_FULL_37_14]
MCEKRFVEALKDPLKREYKRKKLKILKYVFILFAIVFASCAIFNNSPLGFLGFTYRFDWVLSLIFVLCWMYVKNNLLMIYLYETLIK